jgi:hypothetical protein
MRMLLKRLVDEISAGPAAACARDQRQARLQDRAIAHIAPPIALRKPRLSLQDFARNKCQSQSTDFRAP